MEGKKKRQGGVPASGAPPPRLLHRGARVRGRAEDDAQRQDGTAGLRRAGGSMRVGGPTNDADWNFEGIKSNPHYSSWASPGRPEAAWGCLRQPSGFLRLPPRTSGHSYPSPDVQEAQTANNYYNN